MGWTLEVNWIVRATSFFFLFFLLSLCCRLVFLFSFRLIKLFFLHYLVTYHAYFPRGFVHRISISISIRLR